VLHVWDLPVMAFCCAMPWAIIRLIMRRPLRRIAIESLFAGYMGALFYVTFYLPLPARLNESGCLWSFINLVPARTMIGIIRDFPGLVTWQLLGNVVMFVPLGILLPLLSKRRRRFFLTAAAGLSISLGIELVQLMMLLTLISRRSVDVDDIILNVTGACFGYLAWRGGQALS